MQCPRCGTQLDPSVRFCGACGAPVSGAAFGGTVISSGPVDTGGPIERPTVVTLLAVLQLLSGGLCLVAGLLTFVAVASSRSGLPGGSLFALILAGMGAVQVYCGIGLWKLRSYGRTIQLVFAWIGLLGIPVGTVISILILVYLMKPGIKLLFSDRPTSAMTSGELAQIREATAGNSAMVAVVVIVCLVGGIAMVGIVAAIAVPGLLRARMAGNEAVAIGSLRMIGSAEEAYKAMCGGGGYAISLEDLARPSSENGAGFISSELASSNVPRSGYRLMVTRDDAPDVADVGTAADTCNGATGTPSTSYFASAEPVMPGSTGTRYFATDSRGEIYMSRFPIRNPIVQSAEVVPVR